MTWLDTAKRILDRHQFEMVHPETGESVEYEWRLNENTWEREPIEVVVPKQGEGVLFDAFTASMMVQLHDALGDEAKAKFLAMPFLQAHRITMKILEKQP